MRHALVAVWAFVSLAAAANVDAGQSFDYIHVEADSGASSGGHAAIRFGEEVFHFQQADPGIVRAVREPFEYFDYVYRAAGNRGLDVTRVDVSKRTYEALRETFERRHLTEDAHLEVLASAHRDRVLLEYLASLSGEAQRPANLPQLQLRGAGYFFDAATGVAGAAPGTELEGALRASARDALAALSRDVEQARGTAYLARRAATIDGEIDRLSFDCRPAPGLAAGEVTDSGRAFADEYARLLLGRLAIEVLLTGRVPVTRAFRVVVAGERRLDAADLQVLNARATDAGYDVVRLLGSQRRDWGFAVFVKLARIVAIGASIRLERLVVPDVYVHDAHAVDVEPLAARPRLARAVLDERRADFEAAMDASLRPDATDETAWSRMELAANLWLELRDGLRGATPVRIHEGAPLPARDAPFDALWPLPAIDDSTLAAAAAHARDREAELRRSLRSLYGYNVVTRNCVTEIFDTIDSAGDAELEAHVDGHRGLNFVPFVSAGAVNRSYRVAKRVYLPSYRRFWLERCEAGGCAIETRLRETNTLTSSLYEPSRRDDVFLFFTDTLRPLRPIAGAANLVVASGATLAGLVALPFDRGALLEAGVRSFTFSLPELAFLSVRKGSNLLVPRDWTRESPFETEDVASRKPKYGSSYSNSLPSTMLK